MTTRCFHAYISMYYAVYLASLSAEAMPPFEKRTREESADPSARRSVSRKLAPH